MSYAIVLCNDITPHSKGTIDVFFLVAMCMNALVANYMCSPTHTFSVTSTTDMLQPEEYSRALHLLLIV